VPRDAMQQHFDGMEVGDTDAVSGTMDGTMYNPWGLKETNYVMWMMATGGALLADDTCKEVVRKWEEGETKMVWPFKYAKPFDWQFKYRHAVDDHNNLHHALPSIEDAWETN